MSKGQEQICRRHANVGRKAMRYMKRLTVRLMRRWGKKALDDAPKRVPYKGWTD